jgi:murein DD-endopeptidase MepM/ murein hydrolase activator NlpD
LSIRQIVGEIRLAGIGRKRHTRPLFVFVLFLAGGCASQTTISKPRLSGVYHTVTAGETLFRIGKAYGTSYQELARVNGIKDAAQIRVGQRIFIPGATHSIPVETITPTEIAPPAPASPEPVPPFEFLWPVHGTINSGFGPRGMSFHDGIDIAAPEGTPINAIEDGEVIYSQELRGYGNLVILRHAGGFVSVYAHNESNLVREGQSVAKGEVVARVGSTGRVSGPHLHFEIRKNNAAQDPLRYLPQLCCVTASDNVSPKN